LTSPADRGKRRQRSRAAGAATSGVPAGAARAPAGAASRGAGRSRAGTAGRTPFWRHPSLAAALAALALYLPGIGAGFVWDDHLLIEQNPLLRSGAGLARALTSDFWSASGGSGASGMWRPLVTLSYALDGRLAHWQPGWFHAMNALAHALAAALVAALALGTGSGPLVAGLAGILFGAMPAHLESVAWISGRTDVYCALFLLLALLLDRRARVAGRAWPGPGPLLALALALLAKETALPFLLVVAAAEHIGTGRERPSLRSAVRWLAPYAALTVVHLLVHQAWVRGPAAPAAPGMGPQSLRALALMFPGYVAFAWPWFGHTPAVTLEPARAAAWMVVAAVALHAGFVLALAWLLARRAPLALPLALFWLTLLPTLVVDLTQGFLLYSERFFYLPSAGLAWAAAAAVAALRPWRRAWLAGVAALVVLAAGGAVALATRLPAWHDDPALFASMARAAPRNYMARTQWARMLALSGRDAEAARELDAARGLDPSRPEEPSIRAFLASRRGDWPTTLTEAERAIARGNAENEPRLLRAAALLALGRGAEGGAALEELRRRTPGQPAVESLWGRYLLSVGRAPEAYAVLARASALLPADTDAALALALAANDTGHHAEARGALERALRLDPARYEAWLELARTCVVLGDAGAAERALAAAARLPGSVDGRAAALRARLRRAP
jgi:tetratricopeptide (TPR) repeat protein